MFEHAAEQISKRREDATETVVQTAEQNRNRNAVVGHVIENKKSDLSGGDDTSARSESREEFKSPDFAAASGTTVDIQV